ncbi:cytochrome c family protein [Geomonas edaphica]|uniref:cytochrome c family protein n=1 Tax=Geomonas edaphica TaxID=2570226 RepID=UPI0010A85AF0|nr:cytochrome c family protein [Geomonas edaphica]
MIKKALLFLVILTCLPSLALGWTLTAKIGSPSGSIAGGSPYKVVTTGTGYLTIPTGDTIVAVTPTAGYTVSMVTLDGSVISVPAAGGDVAIPQAGKTARTLIAYFTAATYSMTANQTTGGLLSMQRISPTGGSITTTTLTGLRTGNVVRVTATPNTGYSATSISVGGSQVWSGSYPAAVYYDYTVGTSSVTAQASFLSIPTVTARLATATTRTPVNTPVTLDASGSTSNDAPLSYRFQVVSGDPAAVTLTPAGPGPDAVTSFKASLPGDYLVQVTVTSTRGATSTATSPVITVLTQAGYDSAGCLSCHGNRDPAIAAAYQQSTHYLTAAVSCSGCHNPDGSLGHPYLAQPGSSCLPCHSTATPQIATDFSASPHLNTGCIGCHYDHTATSTFNRCSDCHGQPHPWDSQGICGSCHLTHNPYTITAPPPHFNSFSTARYVTSRIGCENCHRTIDEAGVSTFNVYSANRQWGRSGKGDCKSAAYVSFDFKTLGTALPATPANSAGADCVRCHTTTGYVKYVDSGFQDIAAFDDPADRPAREMIVCSACHTPTPFLSYDIVDWDTYTYIPAFSRRDVPIVTAYYNYSTAGTKVLNPVLMPADTGESNNCIVCHTGRTAGSTLRILAQRYGSSGTFWSNTPFIDPHGMAAAGILYGKNGYEFFGKSYSGTFAVHGALGGDDPGSCIFCHMSAEDKHSFSPVQKDASGMITQITAFAPTCSGCHDQTVKPIPLNDPAQLDGKRRDYGSALKALAAVLARKGIYYNAALSPYFFTTGDQAAQGAATAYRNWRAFYVAGSPPWYSGSDLMGAAFNLKLLDGEKGGYAHNSYYVKRLTYDSIDLADDGRLNATVAVTLQNLLATTLFTEEDRARAISWVGVRP